MKDIQISRCMEYSCFKDSNECLNYFFCITTKMWTSSLILALVTQCGILCAYVWGLQIYRWKPISYLFIQIQSLKGHLSRWDYKELDLHTSTDSTMIILDTTADIHFWVAFASSSPTWSESPAACRRKHKKDRRKKRHVPNDRLPKIVTKVKQLWVQIFEQLRTLWTIITVHSLSMVSWPKTRSATRRQHQLKM